MLSINVDPSLLVGILAVAGAYAAFWNAVLKRRLIRKKPFETLPMPDGNSALMGHVQVLAKNKDPGFSRVVKDFADENGRTGFWLGSKPAMSVTKWDDARAILQAEGTRVAPRVQKKHIGSVAGANSILLLNGREWKAHRAAINRAFTPAALKSYRAAMAQVTDTVVASIEKRIERDGQFEFEMEPLMKMITLDVFGLTTFSHSFGCCEELETSEVAASFEVLVNNVDYRMKNNPMNPTNYFYSLPTERNLQHKKAKDCVKSFVSQRMKERLAVPESQRPSDLLSFLLETQEVVDKNGEVGKDVVDDIIMTVLFAGYDTTSITLTYTLHALSQNPQIHQKCVNEVREVGSIDKVEELVYCKSVIREALRFYPPASATSRTIQKPVKLPDGFTVPAGTQVIIPVWAIHHNEANFPRADEFLPERWATQDLANPSRWLERNPSTDNNTEVVPAGNLKAFFAFSGGGRNCPGEKFAMDEAVVVFAGLARAFSFTTNSGYELCPYRAVLIQHPHDRLPMIVTKRVGL